MGSGRLFGRVPIIVLDDRSDAARHVHLLRRNTRSCVIGPFGPVRLGMEVGGVVRWVDVAFLLCVKGGGSFLHGFDGLRGIRVVCTRDCRSTVAVYVELGMHRGVVILRRRKRVGKSVRRVNTFEGGFCRTCIMLVASELAPRTDGICLGDKVGSAIDLGVAATQLERGVSVVGGQRRLLCTRGQGGGSIERFVLPR